jgi:molybdenum cofactor cytidylyltransferase
MNLAQGLRFSIFPGSNSRSTIAFVGSGGKTTALFQLARELPTPVIVTATTHLHVDQVRLADSHNIAEDPEDLVGLETNLAGVMLVTGPMDKNRTKGVDPHVLSWLQTFCTDHDLPLLIEADGSRQRPLKAPADHEPVIPDCVDTVVVVAGLTGLGKRLSGQYVHHPEIYSRLGDLKIGSIITPGAIVRLLTHPLGGMKNIPLLARRIVLLNQADTPEIQAQAQSMAGELLSGFQAVIIASLVPKSTGVDHQAQILAVFEPVAGIILAAGGSSRYGQPKQLLDWHGKPFLRTTAEVALSAGLSPVVVVTGANAEQIIPAINDLPLQIVHNPDWQSGQGSSIRAGLNALFSSGYQDSFQKSKEFQPGPEGIGAAIFLLSDQPQVTPSVLRSLGEEHARTLLPILAPMVSGQRANPVLFDRVTFPDLMALTGDTGGRSLFSKYPVRYIPWHDESLLLDVDTPEDYRKLVDGD